MTENDGYSEEKLKKFKSLLEGKLKEAETELATTSGYQEDQRDHVASHQVDFNERSNHFQRQAKMKEQIRRMKGNVRELTAALHRIEKKTYGICERTGGLIDEARLLVMPTARFNISPNDN